MRIGFDARMIDHPGIGRYIQCLLPELIRQAPNDEFVLFGAPEKLRNFLASNNVKVLRWDVPIYSPWEQFFAFYRPLDVDLVHVPHFNIPFLLGRKMIVTVHDLIYLLFPETLSSGLARFYVRFMINQVVKKATRIIAVSESTKKDLIKMFGSIYASKVDVVYEAADKIFEAVKNKTKFSDVRFRYRLDERIILYVGNIKPHKNIKTLLKVFSLLKKWGAPHQLVICGRWDKKEDHLKETVFSDYDIKYLGEVPTDDLVTLYNMASVLVHLSYYEGFGLTVLEAMQCGLPVVASNASSIPEVASKAAFLVNPHNVEEIANVVYNVLVNEGLRQGMIENGFKQVKQFSWEETARKTLELYRKVHMSEVGKQKAEDRKI